MNRDAGYTLVEMMAALAVIGLAFGGLAAGSHILMRQQRNAALRVATSEELSAAQASLDSALGTMKRNDIVLAEARRIEITCAIGERCGAPDAGGIVAVTRTGADYVAVTATRGYRFDYQTTAGPAARWGAGSRDDLVAVSLTADKPRATPLAVFRLRQEQAFRCEYDVVVASCRAPAP